MAPGEFFFGVNGSDLQTSAAVYAPYMAQCFNCNLKTIGHVYRNVYEK